MFNSIFILLFALNTSSINCPLNTNEKSDFKEISFATKDNGIIEASLFEGNKDYVVVFAHGAVFNKESWYFMAEHLQSKGIASLCIDFRGYGNSKKGNTNNKAFDILGAVDYLKNKGYDSIALVGGSMGGAATLNALEIEIDTSLKKVVLLAPAGGKGVSNKTIDKLIVVSVGESLFTKVNQIFNESEHPKKLKTFKGSFHAQHLFKSEYRDELIKLITDFLTY